MKKALLIIIMAIVEIHLLAACWIVAVIHPRTAKRMVLWSMRTLPGKEWYA